MLLLKWNVAKYPVVHRPTLEASSVRYQHTVPVLSLFISVLICCTPHREEFILEPWNTVSRRDGSAAADDSAVCFRAGYECKQRPMNGYGSMFSAPQISAHLDRNAPSKPTTSGWAVCLSFSIRLGAHVSRSSRLFRMLEVDAVVSSY